MERQELLDTPLEIRSNLLLWKGDSRCFYAAKLRSILLKFPQV